MRKMLLFICICLLFALLFTGCSAGMPDPKKTGELDYSLIKEENSYYLAFDDPQKYEPVESDDISIQVPEHLSFGSLKELYDAVTEGLLSDGQKAAMSKAFAKDEQGRIIICDFDHLQDLKLPKGFKVDSVLWNGKSYGFAIEGAGSGFVRLFSDASEYESVFQREYKDQLSDQSLITVVFEEQNDNKDHVFYKTPDGLYADESYTLEQGGKTVLVQKHYRLEPGTNPETEGLFRTSDTLPAWIKLYCKEDGNNYIVSIYVPGSHISDAELLTFGLFPFK